MSNQDLFERMLNMIDKLQTQIIRQDQKIIVMEKRIKTLEDKN